MINILIISCIIIINNVALQRLYSFTCSGTIEVRLICIILVHKIVLLIAIICAPKNTYDSALSPVLHFSIYRSNAAVPTLWYVEDVFDMAHRGHGLVPSELSALWYVTDLVLCRSRRWQKIGEGGGR